MRVDKSLPWFFIYGIMQQFHFEVVRSQRWDITPITRENTFICLN